MNRCPCCGDLIKAIDRYIAKADSDLEGQLEEAGFLNAKDSVREASDLEDELAEILSGQTEDIVEELGSAKDLRDAKKKIKRFFANDTETTELLTGVFEEYFENVIPALATEYISEIEPDLSVKTLRARTTDWISSWSEELSNLMNLSSENRMGELLQSALDNGDSVADFARKLMEEGIRNEGWTARRAALTEMLRAHNVANNEAIMQSPATDRKRWRHSGAYKIQPRPNHVEMDGQTVPKADPFTLIGADGVIYYPMFPIDCILPPGEAINCHCISQAIVDDDVLGMSLEEREKLQQEIIDNDDGEWEKELDERNKAKAGIIDNRRTVFESIYSVEGEYNPAAAFEISIDGLTEEQNKAVSRLSKKAIDLGHEDGYEHGFTLDLVTGKETPYSSDVPDEIFGEDFFEGIKDRPKNSIVTIHNHADNKGYSYGDMGTYLTNDQLYANVAACHDGRAHIITKKIKEMSQGNPYSEVEQYTEIIDELRKQLKEGKIEPYEFARLKEERCCEKLAEDYFEKYEVIGP